MYPELSAYKTNGFYIAKGLLDSKLVAQTLNSFNKTLTDQLTVLSRPETVNDTFQGLKKLHQLDIDRYIKVVGALWRKEAVYRLLHHADITNFIIDTFGWQELFVPGGQVVHIMAHELKIPNGYFGLVPHQDFPSVQGSLDGVVVWLPLVSVDKDNFPLEVIPGSHRLGLGPMSRKGNSTWEVDSQWYDENQFMPVEVEVGDVVFMSMFTLHRSSINGADGRYRIAVSTRFDNADEPTFIDRAYPSAYVRSVHREQYVEGFPTPELVARIFS
ncbi:MAG: phytanoyl-CoA dioxygenase family protein [Methylomonas sp.]|jgi:ectoine hydroxylase-related dioxygenase (phytanoyl-CoA dioxygenase family)